MQHTLTITGTAEEIQEVLAKLSGKATPVVIPEEDEFAEEAEDSDAITFEDLQVKTLAKSKIDKEWVKNILKKYKATKLSELDEKYFEKYFADLDKIEA